MTKGLLISVGIVVLLSLGVGSYFYFKSQQPGSNEPSTQNSSVVNSAQTQTHTTDTSTSDDNANYINVYMIDLNNMRQSVDVVGCGDGIVQASTNNLKTGDVAADIKTALGYLFSITDREYGKGGMYNALYQSRLTVDSISVDRTSGAATVKISGIKVTSEDCDAARLVAQIERTVSQFSDVKSAQVYVNDMLLSSPLK